MAQEKRPLRPEKSTIDRTLDALRWVFRPLARVSPALAGRAAERLFFTPMPPRRRTPDGLWLRGRRQRLAVEGRTVATWRWGRSGPPVLLLHGWNGWSAQLAAFVEPLLAAGFSVVALDAPGHGASGRRRSSAPQFAAAVRATVQAHGPLAGIVAHSLGAAGATLAVAEGAAVERLVLVAPAADPPAWIPPFASRLGLNAAATTHLRTVSERRIGRSWDELHVPTLVGRLTAPVLVIHDRDDREVAYRDGVAIAGAARSGDLLTTSGLGHVRLLRDPAVIGAAVDFLTRQTARCAGCGTPIRSGGQHCRQCGLEQDLFDPATRWIGAELSSAPASPTRG